ncbi:MAG: hypothetical protein IJX25_03225 [Clostridia bacterium]|nr:hypothetical protein [Clostridia bacterium]MBQ8792525.1 hypothetical protein [Clostridia bacterium]
MKKQLTEQQYFEINAIEHTVAILNKEYSKTHSGDTLCALYFALKKAISKKTLFAKLVNSIPKTNLNKVCKFAGNISDHKFAEVVKEVKQIKVDQPQIEQ